MENFSERLDVDSDTLDTDHLMVVAMRSNRMESIGDIAARIACRLKRDRGWFRNGVHLEMPPFPTAFDLADGRRGDAEFSSDHVLESSVSSDRNDFIGRQACTRMGLALCRSAPAFGVHICVVIVDCSEEQMVGIYTKANVAFVANDKAGRYWPAVVLP
jgi:hypothetical protein